MSVVILIIIRRVNFMEDLCSFRIFYIENQRGEFLKNIDDFVQNGRQKLISSVI